MSTGLTITPAQLTETLKFVVKSNINHVEKGNLKARKAVAVWGIAGIGKTSLVKQLGDETFKIDGKDVNPVVIHLPLAQIEEAGDLSGLPDKEKGSTVYLAPEWMPTKERYGNTPVVFLIDDFNRAEPRILNAIMQLIQDKGTISHDLAPNLTIVLTGNESSSEDQYIVNEVDKAFMTRLMHVTLRFSVNDWAIWAAKNQVDERVIAWAMTYPEMLSGAKGQRTNARSVSDFGTELSYLKTTYGNRDEIFNVLAHGFMDSEPAISFTQFLEKEFKALVSPEDIILRGKNKKITSVDKMGIVMHRMYAYLMQDTLKLEEKHWDNVCKYLNNNTMLTEELLYILLKLLGNYKTNPNYEVFNEALKRSDEALCERIKEVI